MFSICLVLPSFCQFRSSLTLCFWTGREISGAAVQNNRFIFKALVAYLLLPRARFNNGEISQRVMIPFDSGMLSLQRAALVRLIATFTLENSMRSSFPKTSSKYSLVGLTYTTRTKDMTRSFRRSQFAFLWHASNFSELPLAGSP